MYLNSSHALPSLVSLIVSAGSQMGMAQLRRTQVTRPATLGHACPGRESCKRGLEVSQTFRCWSPCVSAAIMSQSRSLSRTQAARWIPCAYSVFKLCSLFSQLF